MLCKQLTAKDGCESFIRNHLLLSFALRCNLLYISTQLLRCCRVKPGKMFFHLHMLLFQPFHNLENQGILMVKMFHDITDFLFTLAISNVVVLCSETVFLGLSVLRHHNHRCGEACLKT